VTVLEATVLAVVQGLTEFLPVSSSAHLVLVPWLLGWPPHELAFDTTLHLGTLAAVLWYFSGDVTRLTRGWWLSLRRRGKPGDADGRLAWWVIVGTVPAALLGYRFEEGFAALFAQPHWVAVFLLITGALLMACERLGRRWRDLDSIGFATALGIGLAQAVAIAPGISRSGATIAAAMLLGLKREPAARFSFLLSIPIIFGAGSLQLLKLFQHGAPAASPSVYVLGFVLAAITGYVCVHWLLSYLRTKSLYPFALYCALVGVACLAALLSRG
jgi:undecaprenyl-diphosphatase